MGRRLLTLALVVGLVSVGCGGGEEPRVRRPQAFFGMNAQQLPALLAAGRLDYVDHSLGEIRGLGVSFVRSVADWRHLEPEQPRAGRHRYRVGTLDSWVTLVSRHHLRWEPIVIGAPAPDWAIATAGRRTGCGALTPEGLTDYIGMIHALASRYGSHGTFWDSHPEAPRFPVTTFEVWNEPNLSSFWCPRPDPGVYARLYWAARSTVHAIEPEATILLGGLAPITDEQAGASGGTKQTPRSFLQAMQAAKAHAQDAIDAIGFHPYGKTPGDVATSVISLRRALDDLGLGETPIVANEFGWAVHGVSPLFPPIPEGVRARYLPEATNLLAQSRCGLIGLAPHTWISQQHNPRSIVDWYGLADPASGAPYPSALAYGEAVHRVEQDGAPSTGPHCP